MCWTTRSKRRSKEQVTTRSTPLEVDIMSATLELDVMFITLELGNNYYMYYFPHSERRGNGMNNTWCVNHLHTWGLVPPYTLLSAVDPEQTHQHASLLSSLLQRERGRERESRCMSIPHAFYALARNVTRNVLFLYIKTIVVTVLIQYIQFWHWSVRERDVAGKMGYAQCMPRERERDKEKSVACSIHTKPEDIRWTYVSPVTHNHTTPITTYIGQ